MGAEEGSVERILLARREWNKNKPGIKTKPAEVSCRVVCVCARAFVFAIVCVLTVPVHAAAHKRARDNRELGICVSSSTEENAEVAFAHFKIWIGERKPGRRHRHGLVHFYQGWLKSSIVESCHWYLQAIEIEERGKVIHCMSLLLRI